MDTEEALAFLAEHQPMPSDEDLTQDLIERYDEVRELFLTQDDARCVPLFLGSFGEGSGWGIYQLVEDVIFRYPHDLVIPALDRALQSPYTSVRRWCLQIATNYSDHFLVPHYKRLLFSEDLDERIWSAHNIANNFSYLEDIAVLRQALASETNRDVRAILTQIVTDHLSTLPEA